jgi:adenylate cyclase
MNLNAFLLSQGVPAAKVEEAERQGRRGLLLLAIEQLILPGQSYYTAAEAAEKAGIDRDLAGRLWRAMGFVDPHEFEPAFTQEDVEALKSLARLMEQGVADPEVAVQMTRVMGLSLSRVAEAQVATAWERLSGPLSASGLDDEEVAEAIATLITEVTPSIEEFVIYVWRRHLAEAAKRSLVTSPGGASGDQVTAVGFCDMAGFTRLGQELEERELAATVDRFETEAYDTIGSLGGRVVKVIGDEVMFVADNPKVAAQIGLGLAGQFSADEVVPDVRVGLAYGPALSREGDYLGATVNLASRIAAYALPGSVLISDELRDEIADDPRFVS